MKKIFSYSLASFLLIGAIFLGFFVKIVPEYNMEISEIFPQKNAENTFEVALEKPKNTWYLGLDKNFVESNFSHPEGLCAKFLVSGEEFSECLDLEDADETSEFYSFPIITKLSNKISFEILYNHEKIHDIENPTLYAINTLPEGKKFAFSPLETIADPMVISRAQWGADETLRYANHPKQLAIKHANLVQASKPKTEKQKKAAQKLADINKFVGEKLANQFTTTEMIRTENGQELVWPIQKVQKVNKIVVHHTADKLDGRSDEEILRAIYAYHAVTRGWGDIGYNYIVGQNGRIYEGRAGGDYVVGAHAAYNNIGSVGISVLGDYEHGYLNANQEIGLKTAIDMAARKYNIDLNATVMGFKTCNQSSCYPIQVVYTPALLGHKDVGITNCPGKNIYASLPAWRKELSQGYNPPAMTQNVVPTPATPIPQNNSSSGLFGENFGLKIQPTIQPTITPNITQNNISINRNITSEMRQSLAQNNYSDQKFRVKLSYPENQNFIELSAFENADAKALLDNQTKNISRGEKISIHPTNNGKIAVKIGSENFEVTNFLLASSAIEINSWSRKPYWDKQNRYNDNIFRDTIEIFNQNGKLVVINHLPMEYYLKGLGEVSNGDLPEKIKTIAVAARGYATFYMQKENRKYNTDRYDGSDDPNSFQRYLGLGYELRSPNVAKMVDATA